MTTTPSTKPWLAVIPLAVALIVRGIYLYFYQSLPDWEMLTVDNYFHHHWAQVIAGGDLLGDTTYFRAPLYVWCLAGLYALFGDGLWVGRLFGLVIGLSSVGMTYAIGRRLFTPSAGLIAAIIHAVYPIAVYFESELLLDPLYTLLLQLAVFTSLGWWQQKGWWRFLLAGGLFGLAAICRPTALVFAIILAVVPIVLFGARRGLPRLGLYVLGLVLIIAPVTIRNISIAGDPVLIASQGGINFYIGNNEEADGVSAVLPEPLGHNWRIEDVVYIAERDLGRSLTPGEVSGYWLGAGFEWILENPGEAAVLYARKLYHHISNTEISNNRNLHDGFSPLSLFDYFPLGFGIIFGLAVAGVIARWPLDSRVRWLTILLLAAILAGSLFFFTSRFRLPLLPYFFVFAAVGLQGLIASWRNAKGQVYSSTIVAVAAALVSYLPIVSLPAGTGVQSALVRGSHYYTAGDYQAALAWYQQAQDLDPTFPEVHLNLGAAWLRLGQADSAMHYFREEIATHPERAKAYANLGSVLLLEDRPREARLSATDAFQRQPYDILASRVLLRSAAADTSLAADSLLAVVDSITIASDTNVYAMNEAGQALVTRRLLAPAADVYRLAAASEPPPIEMDDAAFDRNFPNSPERWRAERAHSYFQLGFLAGLDNRWEDAVRFNIRAITLDAASLEPHLNLVAALQHVGRPQKADSVLQVTRQRFGDDAISRVLQQRR